MKEDKDEKRAMKFQIYKDVKGEYRWKLLSVNGRIIADSAEGYISESYAWTAISKIANSIKENNYIVIDEFEAVGGS